MEHFISAQDRQCRLAFDKVLESSSQDLKVRDQYDRYKIWAANTGAGHTGQAYKKSLDYRLREAHQYRHQVVNVLKQLHQLLVEADSYISGKVEDDLSSSSDEGSEEGDLGPQEAVKWTLSDSEEEDAAPASEGGTRGSVLPLATATGLEWLSSDSRLKATLASIEMAVTYLYRIPVRESATYNRLKRYERSNNSEFDLYLQFDRLFVRDVFPTADDNLVSRLGKLVTDRRRILHYRQLYNDELQREVTNSENAVRLQRPDLSISILPDNSAPSESGNLTDVQPSTLPKSSLKASTFRPKEGQPPDTQQLLTSRISEADEVSSIAPTAVEDNLFIPARPKDTQGQELLDFVCPYCGVFKHIRSDRAWKRHILQDLQPYVCTYDKCTEPDQMFDNREDWFIHESQHYSTFFCGISSHHDYDNVVTFRKHMSTKHSVSVGYDGDMSKMEIFLRRARRLDGNCNLCGQSTAHLKYHMGRHLERIALFALPRGYVTEDGIAECLRDSDVSRGNFQGSNRDLEQAEGRLHVESEANSNNDSTSEFDDLTKGSNMAPFHRLIVGFANFSGSEGRLPSGFLQQLKEELREFVDGRETRSLQAGEESHFPLSNRPQMWECHRCKPGPQLVANSDQCSFCGHRRCSYCEYISPPPVKPKMAQAYSYVSRTSPKQLVDSQADAKLGIFTTLIAGQDWPISYNDHQFRRTCAIYLYEIGKPLKFEWPSSDWSLEALLRSFFSISKKELEKGEPQTTQAVARGVKSHVLLFVRILCQILGRDVLNAELVSRLENLAVDMNEREDNGSQPELTSPGSNNVPDMAQEENWNAIKPELGLSQTIVPHPSRKSSATSQNTSTGSIVGPVVDPESHDNILYVLVLGLAGSGKTRFISNCVGPRYVNPGPTTNITKHRIEFEGRTICFIEAPSFESLTIDVNPFLCLAQLVCDFGASSIHLAVLMLHNVADQRRDMLGRHLGLIKSILGKECYHHVTLVSTYSQGWAPDDPALKDYLKRDLPLRADLILGGATHARLSKDSYSAFQLLHTISSSSARTPIGGFQLRREIYGSRLSFSETSAGSEVLSILRDAYSVVENEIHRLNYIKHSKLLTVQNHINLENDDNLAQWTHESQRMQKNIRRLLSYNITPMPDPGDRISSQRLTPGGEAPGLSLPAGQDVENKEASPPPSTRSRALKAIFKGTSIGSAIPTVGLSTTVAQTEGLRPGPYPSTRSSSASSVSSQLYSLNRSVSETVAPGEILRREYPETSSNRSDAYAALLHTQGAQSKREGKQPARQPRS